MTYAALRGTYLVDVSYLNAVEPDNTPNMSQKALDEQNPKRLEGIIEEDEESESWNSPELRKRSVASEKKVGFLDHVKKSDNSSNPSSRSSSFRAETPSSGRFMVENIEQEDGQSKVNSGYGSLGNSMSTVLSNSTELSNSNNSEVEGCPNA